MSTPKISAATLAAAAGRLAGTVVLDLADMVVGPAVYDARLQMFRTLEGDELGADDGSLVVLVQPGVAMDLVRETTPGRAAAELNKALRMEWSA